MFIAAARSSAAVTGGKTGGILDVSANAMGDVSDSEDDADNTDPSGAELQALFTAAQKLDEKTLLATVEISQFFVLKSTTS